MKEVDSPNRSSSAPELGHAESETDTELRWYGDTCLVSQLNKYLKAVKRQKVSVINEEISKVSELPRCWQRELLLAYIYEENNYDDVDILEKYESAYQMCDQ